MSERDFTHFNDKGMARMVNVLSAVLSPVVELSRLELKMPKVMSLPLVRIVKSF